MIGPRQIADALIAAERERKPIVPFSGAYPFLDIGRAYEAQWLSSLKITGTAAISRSPRSWT